MNYKKVTALVTVDYTEILNISVIDRKGELTTLYAQNPKAPWYRKESSHLEVEQILRYLSGALCHPNITYEDKTAVIYDINFIDTKQGRIYRQPYLKG